MYSPYYSNLFWGFMLVLINIRFGGISILPDFVGFIMIYYALEKLALQHDYYGRAKPFAFSLIFLSLPNIYESPQQNLLYHPVADQNLLMVLLGQAYIIISVLMIYYICRAISALAVERTLTDLEWYSNAVWRFYLVLTVILLIVTPFTLTFLADRGGILIALVILVFISFVLLIHLVYRAGKELGQDTDEGLDMPS